VRFNDPQLHARFGDVLKREVLHVHDRSSEEFVTNVHTFPVLTGCRCIAPAT
jgi:hypothetical protein